MTSMEYSQARPRPHVGFGTAMKNWAKNMFRFSGSSQMRV